MSSYDKYKDANVEWIDKIPAHWNAKRVKYLFTFSRGLSITKENLQDEGVPCVNYGEIHSRLGIELNPEKDFLRCVSTEYLESSPNSLLKRGDFVFADTSEDIEGSGNFTFLNSDVPTFAGYHTIITKPSQQFSSKFLAYYFDSLDYRHQIRSVVNGTKVYSITQSILKNTVALLPSSDEQTAIANYLDEKTAQIDKLIANKQLLIELLKEERKALINKAVNGEGKNWSKKKLKYIAKIISGASFDSTEFSKQGNIRVLKISNIQHDYIDWSDVEYISDEYAKPFQKFRVFNGDIVFALTRPIISSGIKSARAFFDDGEIVLLNQRNAILRVMNKVDSTFIYFVTHSDYFFRMFELSIDNTGQQPNISALAIMNFEINLPPIDEQIEIVQHIKVESRQIDDTITKIKKEIELIQEYKTALISEVVTGKQKVYNQI